MPKKANSGFRQKVPLRILLIDDDTFFLDIIETVISDIAYERGIHIAIIDCCSTIEQATQKVGEENLFHIMVLDIKMPSVDGLTWLHNMRQEKSYLPPTIVVSSSVLESDIMRAYQTNIAGYIVKTGYFNSLRHKLESVLLFYTKTCELPPIN